ncbi:hypothetical protein BD408DRAFT_484082 [Parasitella parasitica]|nr:hypothetical protein BD408DRAFT_484082 [Parasitella parasitica]
MKSAFVIAAVGAFVVASVQAQCECDPSDSACLSECVGNTQECISECHNNECYNRCISYHWPGVNTNTQSNVWEHPTSTMQAGSASATPTSGTNGQSSMGPTSSAWAPSSAPTMGQSSQWPQSSGWPSSATVSGYSVSGAMPSASASATTSTSGSSSTFDMSKAILGLTLAAAAYAMQ